MRIGTRARRLIYLVHRWTGVAGCVLMALWFVSGVVMLYVGYPKLTPGERLSPLPALQADCCSRTGSVLGGSTPSAVGLVLTSIGGESRYLLHDGRRLRVLDAADGKPLKTVTVEHALAEARVFAPDAPLRHLGEIDEDRWTHSGGLNPHRPLHRIKVGGAAPGLLYVSSTTGQVVMDVPRHQQYWNYAGAWLHWLYMFRDRPVDPGWSWLVIVLSAAGTITALTGVVVGIWRWRFSGRYKSGARTPYQGGWMRWHHIAGLIFSAFVCAWIFSGLMSMNPFGVFSPKHGRPDVAAYRGPTGQPADGLAHPTGIIAALRGAGFTPVELHWRRLGGEPYVLAYDAHARTRVVRADLQGVLSVATAWQPGDVLAASRRLFAAPPAASELLTEYDTYYYQRHPEAMHGARSLGLPALRLDYQDPGRTRVYIDLRTGNVALSLDAAQRVNRWLFYFLHSWDTPALLRHELARELALIALSLGGLAVSLTGVVIGWRRIRVKTLRPRARQ